MALVLGSFETCFISELKEVVPSMKKTGSSQMTGRTILLLPALFTAFLTFISMITSNVLVPVPKASLTSQKFDHAEGRGLVPFILQLDSEYNWYWATLERQ